MPHNYRTSSYVRFTPEPMRHLLNKRQHNLATWFSQQDRIMGIAQSDYALIVPVSHGVQLVLETIDLDRGHYEDELTLRKLTGEPQVLAAGPVGTLNSVVDTLKSWLVD